jgi:hypothetical protein
MNIAMLQKPVADKSDLKRLAGIAINYFKGRNNPWFLTGSETWFRSNAGEVLRDLGLGCKLKLVGMVAERLAPPQRSLPDVKFSRIDNEATRNALADLTADSYGVPREWGRGQWQILLFGRSGSLELSPT